MPLTYGNDIQKTKHKTKRKQYNYFAIWEYCVESLIVYNNAQDKYAYLL